MSLYCIKLKLGGSYVGMNLKKVEKQCRKERQEDYPTTAAHTGGVK